MRSWLFLLFFLINFAAFGQEYKFPEPIGVVNDFEHVFSNEESSELTKIIIDFEKKSSNEIAIITVDHIGPYTDFNDFCIDMSNHYGVGKRGKDNGLTIIFSKTLRRVRINSGTGTGKILTNEVCAQILNESILPAFKKGNYFDGIKNSLLELMEKWELK